MRDGTITIDARVADAGELRAVWLDDIPHGGLFIGGSFSVAAGANVRLRIQTARPPSTTILDAVVVWRRLPPAEARRTSAISLRPGIGVAFTPAMHARVAFLSRLSRGADGAARAPAYDEGRRSTRYPTSLRGEIVVPAVGRGDARAHAAVLRDVAVHGAALSVADAVELSPGQPISLRLAPNQSGESALSSLHGRVAWVGSERGRAARRVTGVQLRLDSAPERLHWAKIVTRARQAFEHDPIRVSNLVG